MSERKKVTMPDFNKYYDILFHPSKIGTKRMDVSQSITFYYKLSILPMILFIAAGFVFSNSLQGNILLDYFWGSIGYVISIILGYPFAQPSLAGMQLVIATAAIYLWAIFPLIALILSMLLHIFLKNFIKAIRLKYSNTLSAFVFGISAAALLSWLIVLPFFLYSYLGLIFILIIMGWSVTIAVISLSMQQRISRIAALNGISALVTFIILITFFAVTLFYAGNICSSPIIVNHVP